MNKHLRRLWVAVVCLAIAVVYLGVFCYRTHARLEEQTAANEQIIGAMQQMRDNAALPPIFPANRRDLNPPNFTDSMRTVKTLEP